MKRGLSSRSGMPGLHELVLGILFVGLMIAARMTDPAFVGMRAQIDLSTHVWELALLSLPMTAVILTAGIDLSVGSIVALSAVVLGLTWQAGLAPGWAAGLAMLTGLLAGSLNGWFVAQIRVHPLIVTLATLAAYRGIAEGISLGKPISGFPESFGILGRGYVLGLPIPGMLFALLTLLAIVALIKTPWGRMLYAIGHNETASRFSGVPVDRLKILVYSISGLFSGMAAVILVSRRNTAKADLGTGLELDVITSVVLGGTSIFGGRGNILGTLLGVLLIHETREYVSWRWNREELNLIVIGLLLIGSVLLQKALSRNAREET